MSTASDIGSLTRVTISAGIGYAITLIPYLKLSAGELRRGLETQKTPRRWEAFPRVRRTSVGRVDLRAFCTDPRAIAFRSPRSADHATSPASTQPRSKLTSHVT